VNPKMKISVLTITSENKPENQSEEIITKLPAIVTTIAQLGPRGNSSDADGDAGARGGKLLRRTPLQTFHIYERLN
jgi:hypothetical protein